IAAQLRRAGRIRERMLEAIRRNTVLIDTAGDRIGQINGLSLIELGGHAFGHPTRITARARVGDGKVVDIEREVELGGPIHSKGVLILTGLLGARYALHLPLSLSATIVFEQSYGGVEGDSASLAELCALLSAIAELPIKQACAVTGSVNQHGELQPVGGVNEKIEGFFDVCQDRGLTGEQGVIIPRSNVPHLMLRKDVVAAIADGRFHVHAASSVDDAIELVTGRAAGQRDAEGHFPEGSVNALVEGRLVGFAEDARRFLGLPERQATVHRRRWSA
ncbi:MAG TPA: S16 family serine protease, partial [Kofleriaceae bacterium]|nr:S16 family serine protease [Kofleriaceae bacterium]